MSFNESCDLPHRLADALRRRLTPNSNLSHKQLAYAIQASERQVWSWIAATNMPTGRHLLSLITFFDAGFVNALTAGRGAPVIKLQDRRAMDAAAKIAEGIAELRALG